MLFSVI